MTYRQATPQSRTRTELLKLYRRRVRIDVTTYAGKEYRNVLLYEVSHHVITLAHGSLGVGNFDTVIIDQIDAARQTKD